MRRAVLKPGFLTVAALVAFSAAQSLAMKNRQQTFLQPCEAVWKASVAVAKMEQYRVVSISTEEQIISVVVGGVWGGERIVSLSLATDNEGHCRATVQSRFSGLAHSDGPDFLARIRVELVGETMRRDSKAFRRFEDCVENSPTGYSKCEKRLRSQASAEAGAPAGQPLWNTDKP
jgi:hypothetical protein